jgi:capsular polysaccharide transport system permease protein
MTSRDAVASLIANNHLREILSRPNADIFNRFPNFYSLKSDEWLYQHFLWFIDAEVDDDSGIGTLDVWAFNAQDGQDVARALLRNGEALINQMNARAFADTVKLASQFVDEEKGKFLLIENQLTAFRNSQKVIDPNHESSAALSGISDLMSTLMKAEADLSQQIEVTPSSPKIGTIRETIASLRDEIAKQRAALAGSDASLANKFSEFDRLMLDRELVSQSLQTAVAQLNSARMNADRPQFYLQTIAEPNLADYPRYPHVTLDMSVIVAISFCVFWISRMMLRNIWEHKT